ncbi:hypothetical protein V6N13_051139 [Hibiscus sabdariffa]|uniref:Uncharacterized protein n=1 Tax=Hibiscus sabdariffa TaxID=183260 RepID=A0ABR2T3D3_9ROSI
MPWIIGSYGGSTGCQEGCNNNETLEMTLVQTQNPDIVFDTSIGEAVKGISVISDAINGENAVHINLMDAPMTAMEEGHND